MLWSVTPARAQVRIGESVPRPVQFSGRHSK